MVYIHHQTSLFALDAIATLNSAHKIQNMLYRTMAENTHGRVEIGNYTDRTDLIPVPQTNILLHVL